MIKRATTVVMLAAFTLVVSATAALAQTSTYPVSPTRSTSVEGAGGSNGTAFTGSSQIPLGTLMIVAFVVIGLTALLVARRRAARFAG